MSISAISPEQRSAQLIEEAEAIVRSAFCFTWRPIRLESIFKLIPANHPSRAQLEDLVRKLVCDPESCKRLEEEAQQNLKRIEEQAQLELKMQKKRRNRERIKVAILTVVSGAALIGWLIYMIFFAK